MTASLTLLGTSDGLPAADRYHASLLLKFGGRQILLDCGEPCSHTLKRMGVGFDSLDAVIVTHTHSDHIGGLPMLLQSMWLEQRTRSLAVWLPRRAIVPLRQWLRTCLLFEEQIGFRIRWQALTASTVIRVGPIRVRAFRTSHLDRTRAKFARTYPQVGFDAFCLLVQAGGQRFGYSADLGAPQDLQPLCAKPLAVLVTELAHFHPDALVAVLRDRPIRRLVITHMGRTVRQRLPAVQSRFKRGLQLKRLTFAADGDVIRF